MPVCLNAINSTRKVKRVSSEPPLISKQTDEESPVSDPSVQFLCVVFITARVFIFASWSIALMRVCAHLFAVF